MTSKGEIISAVKEKEYPKIKELLASKSTDLSEVDEDSGESVLQLAIDSDDVETVRLIYESGRISDFLKDSMKSEEIGLTYSAMTGKVECLKYILSMEDHSESGELIFYAYFYACLNGHLDCVKFLLNNTEVDKKRLQEDGSNALFWSIEKKEVLEYLFNEQQIPAIEDSMGQSILDAAVVKNSIRGVNFALDQCKINPNRLNEKIGISPLSLALFHSNLDIVKCLLSRGASLVLREDVPPLSMAAFYSNDDIWDFLETSGVLQTISRDDFYYVGWMALSRIDEFKDMGPLFKHIVPRFADPSFFRSLRNVITMIIYHGRKDLLEVPLRYMFENCPNEHKEVRIIALLRQALTCECKAEYLEFLRLLKLYYSEGLRSLTFKSKLNRCFQDFIQRDKSDFLLVLMDSFDIDPNYSCPDGQWMLWLAVMYKEVDLVRAFIARGLQIVKHDEIVDIAIGKMNIEMIHVLAEHGFNFSNYFRKEPISFLYYLCVFDDDTGVGQTLMDLIDIPETNEKIFDENMIRIAARNPEAVKKFLLKVNQSTYNLNLLLEMAQIQESSAVIDMISQLKKGQLSLNVVDTAPNEDYEYIEPVSADNIDAAMKNIVSAGTVKQLEDLFAKFGTATPITSRILPDLVKIAIKKEQIEILNFLRKTFNFDLEFILECAIENGNRAVFELIDFENKNAIVEELLIECVERDDLETLRIILKNFTPYDRMEESHIVNIAVENYDHDIVKALCVAGFSCNVTDSEYRDSPLYYTIQTNNEELTKLLLNRGAVKCIGEKNPKNMPAYFFAVIGMRDYETAMFIINMPAFDPEIQFNGLNIALAAVAGNSPDIFKICLQEFSYIMDPNAWNQILFVASEYGSIDFISLIITLFDGTGELVSKISNEKNVNGETSLDLAIKERKGLFLNRLNTELQGRLSALVSVPKVDTFDKFTRFKFSLSCLCNSDTKSTICLGCQKMFQGHDLVMEPICGHLSHSKCLEENNFVCCDCGKFAFERKR